MSADKFSEIFSGLEEAYGTYEIQKQQVNGKQSGQASVLRSPRTAQTWEGHLSGKGPAIGIIPINADNNCKWGCIDIDQYWLQPQRAVGQDRRDEAAFGCVSF